VTDRHDKQINPSGPYLADRIYDPQPILIEIEAGPMTINRSIRLTMNPNVPEGEAWIVQDGEIIYKFKNISKEKGLL